MAQFTVYRNTAYRNNNPAQNNGIPYLLDVQSDLLDVLQTRVVVPLALPGILAGKGMQRLSPLFEVEGQTVVMLTPELAGIHVRLLGPEVTSLSAERDRIIAALDFVFLSW